MLPHEIDLVRDTVADSEIPVLPAMRETVVTDFSRRLGVDVDFALPARPMRLSGSFPPDGA